MEISPMRSFILPTVFAALFASSAVAQTSDTVKSIAVTAELSAVTNPAAAAFWATLDTDLETAIAVLLADRIADKGAEISVDIEEVSLSNGFTDVVGLAETRLVGDIAVRDDDDSRREQFYTLTVDVNAATQMMPAGTDITTIPADTRVYYDAMIAAFANAVVRDLR
jgi:hypothetical protein